MTIKLTPMLPDYGGTTRQVFSDPNWSWLASQPYEPNRVWAADSGGARGKLEGGPSYSRLLSFGRENELQWSPVAHKPALTTPALPDTEAFYKRQLGVIEWNSIDPMLTFDQAADQGDLAFGAGNPLAGLRDIESFLTSKDVDPFGNAPARAADYALSFPLAVMSKLTGITAPTLAASPPAQPFAYRFQADRRYWQTVASLKPEQLDGLARSMVSQYADPDSNHYLVEKLRAQFDIDRMALTGQSSGNEAIDYASKKIAGQMAAAGTDQIPVGYLPLNPASVWGSGLFKIPGIGTQLASVFDPVNRADEAAWQALTPKVRRQILGQSGFQQMAYDFVGALPALSGLGTVLALAKSAGPAGAGLVKAYDWTLRGAGYMMTAGLTAATANWALEAAWPGYSEALGEQIDRARPVSSSMVAGAVNAVGFWSSGTWGASGLFKGLSRVVRPAARGGGAVLGKMGVPTFTLGLPEMPIYSVGHGGAVMDERLIAAGLDAEGLRISKQRLALSYVSHAVRDHDLQMYDSAIRGEPTGDPRFDQLDPAQRVEVANERLLRADTDNGIQTEVAFRLMTIARQDATLFKGDEGRRFVEWAKAQDRTINDRIAARYVNDYGPAFFLRAAGGNDVGSIKRWTEDALTRLGQDPADLHGVHGQTGWEQAMRSVYHYEFDNWNGEVAKALEMDPPPREAPRVTVMSSRHLFNNDVEVVLADLNSEDPELARAMVGYLIADTIEVERWFSQEWIPPRESARSVDLVDPKVLARWIEDIAPALPTRRILPSIDADTSLMPLNAVHRRLEDTGLWTLAFKPVDEEGRFISYAQTRGSKALGKDIPGSVFKTPWLDYPMESADNIELGNRGFVMSKLDGVFRGFRTWRLVEFQRGSLFRRLTADFPFTATQIDEFHGRLLQMTREFAVQPQTLGTVGRAPMTAGSGEAYRSAVERIADDVFGAGPYVTKGGGTKEIDWLDVIAKSYRQSLKLNLTAGLTSHLKSHFGPIGSGAAYFSDIGYVNLRFNWSPLFKAGELEESVQLNLMNGVSPGGDAYTEALFYRQGIGNDYGIIGQEQTYDQLLQGLAKPGRQTSNDRRAATGYSWYGRHLPETFAQQQAREAVQGAHLNGEFRPAEPPVDLRTYPKAEMVSTERLAQYVEVNREERPKVRGDFAHLDDLTESIREHGMTEPINIEYDPATGTAMIADGNHRVAAALRLGIEAIPARVTVTQGRHVGPFWDLAPADRAAFVAKLGDEGWLFHGSAQDPSLAGDAAAVDKSGFFTAANFDYAEWYGRGDIRNAPEAAAQGTVYLARRPPENKIADFGDDALWGRIVARVEQDAAPIIDRLEVGENVARLRTELQRVREGVRARDVRRNRVSPLYGYAMARSKALGGDLFDSSWVRQLVKDEGFDAWRAPEEGEGIGIKSGEVIVFATRPELRSVEDVYAGGGQKPLQDEFKPVDKQPQPNELELDMRPSDLWNTDRPDMEPVATGDREAMLRQLNETRTTELEQEAFDLVDDDGSVIPGMVGRFTEIIEELKRLDAEDPNRDVSADAMENVFGTPEMVESLLRTESEKKPGFAAKLAAEARAAGGTFWAPVPFKQQQATRMQVALLTREFPLLLQAAGAKGVIKVLKDELHLPERGWATFLMRDRELLLEAQAADTPEAWQALFDHAGGDELQGKLDELYNSPEWAAITGLWTIAAKTAQDEAFKVHFFNPYRSAAERSINHPLLGVYPASWAYKAARQWVKFLFDNRTFGDLRLGMSPAVALNHWVAAQNVAFAQENDETLQTFMQDGPLGSTFFIANLIMPGDWSSIPFPLSRTIRDVLRGQRDAAALVTDNMTRLGVTRDLRLLGEMLGEAQTYVGGPEANSPDNPWRPPKAGNLYTPLGLEPR